MQAELEPASSRWAEALTYMRHALNLLDESEAPPHIGAHLDLAIAQLQELTDALPGGQPQVN